MPRASTKTDLITSSNEGFEKMWDLIDSIPQDQQNVPFQFGDLSKKKGAHWERDKNLRDILIHLYEWHQLLLNWVESNQNGEETPFLPAPYNWRSYGEMNIEFWKKHQSTSYEGAKNRVKESHKKVMEMIEGLSNEALFSEKHFSWTGTSILGAYCVSATSSHYEWAAKVIKLHKKSL